MFDRLFSPVSIRQLTLKNRIVMSAMGTHESAASPDGKSVTDKLIAYHVARAKGGCGLNTVEVTSVDAASAPTGFLTIADDDHIVGFKKLNDAVHAVGGKTCIQLWQGGLAVAGDPTVEILLPCDMPLSANYTCPAITTERLVSVIDAFGKAAKRAVEAGFDCLEFHCAHNYLPHSMLSGGINHRTDEWGGSFENREKFPLACIKAIRANMPEGMPLLMRIDCHDDRLEGGLTVEEVIAFCKDAKAAGVDLLNVSRGNILTAATMYEVAPCTVPNGFNVEDAARIRRETGMLTMPCGRINTPEYAEQILRDDKADLIVMARAQLADPEFCNKAKAGKLNEIHYCLGCNQGCYDYFVAALSDPAVEHITCARNPAVLEEETIALTPAKTPKTVLIVGGGMAGLEAAIDLKLTGNTPVLCEASDKLGGQTALTGEVPGMADFVHALSHAVAYVRESGIDVRLNTPVTSDLIRQIAPDAVIVASGSRPTPTKYDDKAVDAFTLLQTKDRNGKTAVVIGDDVDAVECAQVLANRGFTAMIVAQTDNVVAHFGTLRQIAASLSFAESGITVLSSTTVVSVEDHAVTVKTADGERILQADVIVSTNGTTSVSSDELQETCEKMHLPCFVVGDAKKGNGSVLRAVHDSFFAVCKLNQA